MQAAYESFRRDGRLPASYEVVFAHAWVPAVRHGATDEARVSLDAVKRELLARRGK